MMRKRSGIRIAGSLFRNLKTFSMKRAAACVESREGYDVSRITFLALCRNAAGGIGKFDDQWKIAHFMWTVERDGCASDGDPFPGGNAE